VPRRKHTSHQTNAAQRRIALTSAYLKVICPRIDKRARKRLADSILALIDGEARRLPQKKITDPQAVEMVWRNMQCINRRCPLLIFGKQLADELNEFFAEGERSGDAF
jgi:hypothetical protein